MPLRTQWRPISSKRGKTSKKSKTELFLSPHPVSAGGFSSAAFVAARTPAAMSCSPKTPGTTGREALRCSRVHLRYTDALDEFTTCTVDPRPDQASAVDTGSYAKPELTRIYAQQQGEKYICHPPAERQRHGPTLSFPRSPEPVSWQRAHAYTPGPVPTSTNMGW